MCFTTGRVGAADTAPTRMRLLPVDTEPLGLQQAAERNLEDRLGEVTADTA